MLRDVKGVVEYPDGFELRSKNRRCCIYYTNDYVGILFVSMYDKIIEQPDTPSQWFRHKLGKTVVYTSIKMREHRLGEIMWLVVKMIENLDKIKSTKKK